MARFLIITGLILVGVGALVAVAGRLPWLGRLPGDVLVHRGRFTIFLPLTTSLLLSAVVTLLLWLFSRR